MARRAPDDRFHELIQAATAVFLEQGYRRAQIADVAERLGVAKGTVYLYVESKEALLDAALEYADAAERIPMPSELPVPTPRSGATLRKVQGRVAAASTLPALAAALERRRVSDSRAELEAILRELYTVLAQHRVGIKLLDRCAQDYPELASVFYRGGRIGVLTLLRKYLESRARRKLLRPLRDPATTARIALETAVYWAVHRHWDPAPQPFDEHEIGAIVVDFIAHALIED